MTSVPLRTLEDLRRISTAYRQTLILLTANRLGIFELLDRLGSATAHDIAKQSHLSHRGAEILLDALVAIGLLRKHADRYTNSSLAASALVPGCSDYLGHIFDHNLHLLSRWTHLPDVVRTGQPAPRPNEERAFRAFILGMADLAKQGVRQLLRAYDFSGVRTLLDLGGGPGVYAAEISAVNPGLEATVFDLPQTKEIVEATSQRYGLQGRMRFLGGDYLSDDYGGPYQVILMSSIIHSLGETQIRHVLGRCFDALEQGGHLLIRDFFLDGTRTHPPANAIFAVNMLVASECGRCYTWTEVKGWLQHAGYGHLKQLWLDDPPRAGLLVGVKP